MGGRTPGSGSHAFKTVHRHIYGGTVPSFRNCIHVDGMTGELCGQPTKDGAQRCPDCTMHLITLTDRVKQAQPAQTEPVNWRAQGPTRDRRKTKAA